MDRYTLSKVDEELTSSNVKELCFLCQDFVNRKHLENVVDGKGLFMRLEEKGLLGDDAFLSQLLHTIGRNDLVPLLRTGAGPITETDAKPMLFDYRVMLYDLYSDITEENLDKMKYLLEDKLGRFQMEKCQTSLDVFVAMEKKGLLSNTNLNELYVIVSQFDCRLAEAVHTYAQRMHVTHETMSGPQSDMSENVDAMFQTSLSVTDALPSGESLCSDAKSDMQPSPEKDTDYYPLTHNPHGLCVIINNEEFKNNTRRTGTKEDERALLETFTALGFKVEAHNNLDSAEIKKLLIKKSQINFQYNDALVVCVLSHGLKDCVYGSDDVKVTLNELTKPFNSYNAPSLAGKPKLFFIQACQGTSFQRGSLPCVPQPKEDSEQQELEEDAGPVEGETVPWDADFLLGMSTVPECKSFRNRTTGSIYIQELCKQLNESAQRKERDDILTVLTRVNRNVGRFSHNSYKQMPEPKYTLTKKLVLEYM